MLSPQPSNNFNDVLVQELGQRGMSHKDLADLIGVSQNSVSNWTTGRYRPRHQQMQEIAFALDMTIDALHGRAAPPPPTSSATAQTATRSGRERASKHAESDRIVRALAELDLEDAFDAVRRVAPPLMEILAAAQRHVRG